MRRIVLLLAVLALIAAAGCGESEDEQFANEVNEICTDGEGEAGTASDPDELIETIDEYVRRLGEVDPPDDRREDYEAWVATQERISNEMRAALRARDRERLNAVDEDAGDAQARELGLDDCAE